MERRLYDPSVAYECVFLYAHYREGDQMDAQKTGALIRKCRTKKKMTQKQLADVLHVSDKAVSKWECGLGYPDVSLMDALSTALDVDMISLMRGSLNIRKENGGNMRRICFYVCPVCGNIVTATAGAEITCCSMRLEAMKVQPMDEAHRPVIEDMDGEWYIRIAHPMEKEHYIRFVACVRYDRVTLVSLYPEQGAELRLPALPRCSLYIACSGEGLYRMQT